MAIIQRYQPVPVVDTADLTRDEWLEYRKHGLGASDIKLLMKADHEEEARAHKTVLTLFQEKISRKPVAELERTVTDRKQKEEREGPPLPPLFGTREVVIDPNSDFNLSIEIGKALEPVLGKYISCRLGLPVYRDTFMYQHPKHPYLLVDLDFMMVCPDPETGEMNCLAIVECKTATFWKREAWENGVPWGYELQCRAAMCVMNVDRCYIICAYDNNDGGIALYCITRDYNIEADIIMTAKTFWVNHVEKEILPIPEVPTKAAKGEMAEYARRQQKTKPPQLFERGLSELINLFLIQAETANAKKEEADRAKEELGATELKLASYMFNHDEAVCGDVKLRWKERNTRSTDYDALKLAHPLIYAQYVKETPSLGFEAKVSGKASSKSKEAA